MTFIVSFRKKTTGIILLSTIFIFLSAIFVCSMNPDAKPVNSDNNGIKVPIIMYHSILNDTKMQGNYVVTSNVFKNDMLYLKEKGYTSIFVSELIDYVYNGTQLPEKPVIITFDDGYLNNYTYILPVLEEMDIKAVISVIGIQSELYSNTVDRNNSYAHVTWQDIKDMSNSKHFEIGNHTYNMHDLKQRKGLKKKSSETVEQYQKSIKDDISKLQDLLKENTGISTEIFTYPFGFMSPEALPVIKELGFKAALTCTEKVNYITNDIDKLYNLYRFNRPSGISTEKFMKKITGD